MLRRENTSNAAKIVLKSTRICRLPASEGKPFGGINTSIIPPFVKIINRIIETIVLDMLKAYLKIVPSNSWIATSNATNIAAMVGSPVPAAGINASI